MYIPGPVVAGRPVPRRRLRDRPPPRGLLPAVWVCRPPPAADLFSRGTFLLLILPCCLPRPRDAERFRPFVACTTLRTS